MSAKQHPALYGPDLAAIYRECWEDFARELWPRALAQVRRHAPRAASWLDLCCGTGATLAEAARAGFEVAGVDLSPHQLAQARAALPGAPLVAADIRKFDLGRRFDVVSCFYDSLNYLLRPADLLAAFRRARRHLAPGGVFVFDINTLEGMRQNWNQTLCLRGEGYTAIAEYIYSEDENLGLGRFEGFIRDGKVAQASSLHSKAGKMPALLSTGGLYRHYDELHLERGYEAPEIEALLARAGLIAASKLDAYAGGRAGKKTEKLLYTCYCVGAGK